MTGTVSGLGPVHGVRTSFEAWVSRPWACPRPGASTAYGFGKHLCHTLGPEASSELMPRLDLAHRAWSSLRTEPAREPDKYQGHHSPKAWARPRDSDQPRSRDPPPPAPGLDPSQSLDRPQHLDQPRGLGQSQRLDPHPTPYPSQPAPRTQPQPTSPRPIHTSTPGPCPVTLTPMSAPWGPGADSQCPGSTWVRNSLDVRESIPANGCG